MEPANGGQLGLLPLSLLEWMVDHQWRLRERIAVGLTCHYFFSALKVALFGRLLGPLSRLDRSFLLLLPAAALSTDDDMFGFRLPPPGAMHLPGATCHWHPPSPDGWVL